MNTQNEDFYKRLKEELSNSTLWPAEYLFKFIVPTDTEKISRINNAFNGMGAVIKTTKSKNGKYTSISINVKMQSSQAVIDKYIELSDVEGIISL
ncbi:MAG: hypothetical protein BM557_10515 [Flavobacterium sp. MedPE-SWcel]|uniref:DUF493 family protein n=1 Tax=uncultured Flavobacterium sp. TaxID=165435 RepID=UPI00091108D4|nr:DUF493 family protein [uncultured Flavobacterium sp.]OIQ16296.1 MAG: hypothetical protein BM557_10515 [Flavobacterium sp. MedPE-SWcel]